MLAEWPSAAEGEFKRLKNEAGLTPLRTRGLSRVRQHADLVMTARLGAGARSGARGRARGEDAARGMGVPVRSWAARREVWSALVLVYDRLEALLALEHG